MMKFPYLIRFLFFLLLGSAANGPGCYAQTEVWDIRSFIRVDTTIGLTVREPELYFAGSLKDKLPSRSELMPIPSKEKERTSLFHSSTKKDFLFRVVLYNSTAEAIPVAVRTTGLNESIRVCLWKGDNHDVFVSGNAVHWIPLKKGEGYYDAGLLKVPPGVSTVYFKCEDVWLGAGLYHLDIIHESQIKDDRYEYIASNLGMTIPVLVFNFLIFFQLVYVIIQWHYHREKEYVDYLLYLICIGIYFGLRLAFTMKFNHLLGINRDWGSFINQIMLLLPYIFYLRFARHFIEMDVRFPAMNKLVIKSEWIILAGLVPVVAAHLLGRPDIANTMAYSIIMVLFVFTVYLIRFFYLKRDHLIRFVLIGSLFASTGHFVAMSISMLYPYGIYLFPPLIATMTGIVFEIIFFNTGLGYKAKAEHLEKLKTQAELIQQLDENKKIQERLHDMRNRIASDLHDDVGSTLSSIGLYSDIAAQQMEQDPKAAQTILNKISDSSRRMMEAMSDIVWAIHSKNDEADSITTRMTRFAAERLSPTGIGFELNKSPQVDNLTFSIEARRCLLMLFKEAVNNAAKYSKAEKIAVNMSVDNGNFIMTVSDDGCGFDTSVPGKGNGLTTMLDRARKFGGNCSIVSAAGSGTIVKAVVPVHNMTLAGDVFT